MDPVLTASLIGAATTVLGSLSAYLIARTRQIKSQTKIDAEKAAAPIVDAELGRIAERRGDLAKEMAAVLTDWSEKTPERVTRKRCDSKHRGVEKQLETLAQKVDSLSDSVGELGREVSHLVGVVTRSNGGSSS